MDSIDYELLDTLQADGRVTVTELARRLGLSAPAVADRMRKLERQGVIKGYRAHLSRQAVGLGLLAFIGVTVEQPRYNGEFLAGLRDHPEVLECHHVAGDDSYLLKVACRDTEHLEALITHGIKAMPGITRTKTTIVLSTTLETTALPISAGVANGGEA